MSCHGRQPRRGPLVLPYRDEECQTIEYAGGGIAVREAALPNGGVRG